MANAIATERTATRRLFVATIFAGSFLLFLVQPMVARMALPRLGGAPAVWNSAMLVYQALLLAGYGYAHWLGRMAPARQALVHLGVLALAALWLPVHLIAAAPPADGSPALWVPWLLGASIGPLFFAVAAQAPLMQRWFAARAPGADPYPLYAASNLGSFGGLLAYPLLVEPLFSLGMQSALWTAGFLLLVPFVGACALLPVPARVAPVIAERSASTPGARQWLSWIGLAAIPSALMLSTTTHLTTDLVAMPLLWVLPLGLYLLSFSIAFAARRAWTERLTRIAPYALLLAAGLAFAMQTSAAMIEALIGLSVLLIVSVALHGALYDRRPEPAQLTAFYLAMAIGGVVGGIVCALVAPMLFDWVYEHPLGIALAALAVPQAQPRIVAQFWAARDPAKLRRWLLLGALLLSLVAGGLIAPRLPAAVQLLAGLAVGALALAAIGRRVTFALALALVMLSFGGWEALQLSLAKGARTRSYFGVYTVGASPDGGIRVLIHGTTLHGIERLTNGHEADPTTYYAPLSGVGVAMRALPAIVPNARVAVVGLGAGTLACYRRPGQDWRFFEIDPAVVVIARDRARFQFLARCAPNAPIIVGDARLTLAAEPAASRDALVIDAFSSDSVPMHLLTREAFAIYAGVLAPRGLLLIHISNRYVALEPVLAAAAAAAGWHAVLREYTPDAAAREASAVHSVWVAMARDPALFAPLATAAAWRPLVARPGMAAWTDDHASILPLLKWDTNRSR